MKLHKDILTEKERKKLLNFVKTQVKDFGPKAPGLQSTMDLHTHKQTQNFFKILLDKYFKGLTIENAWANYTKGDEFNWHNHPTCHLSAVYFLQNPDSLGTIFRNQEYEYYDKIIFTKCPENSLLVFEGGRVHSQPISPKKINRYTIAVDLI